MARNLTALGAGWRALVMLVALGGPAAASTFLKLDLPALNGMAESVVHARVVAITSEWNQERTFIFTHVTLQRVASLRGDAADTIGELVVRVPGGTVDDFTAEMDGAPRFELNQEVVVFLAHWPDGALMVSGYEQGLSRVETDPSGVKVLRGGVVDAMPLHQLASELRAGGTSGGR